MVVVRASGVPHLRSNRGAGEVWAWERVDLLRQKHLISTTCLEGVDLPRQKHLISTTSLVSLHSQC